MPLRQLASDSFRFQCHKGIECFTKCCAALQLVLSPYDIIRMKKRLNMPSQEFLEHYTITKMDDHKRFPMVYLKMSPDDNKRCPFVSPNGCTIYEDRPGACRIYPLGRATAKPEGGRNNTIEDFFVVEEAHCLGFKEEKEWSIDEWMKNEGLKEYNEMNDHWLDILASGKSLGQNEDVPRKIQMFFMASYNLDRFRDFIFRSRFLDLFHIESDLRDSLKSDDVALLIFAFDWLKFSLFGEQTIHIKS
ncbi:MAG: YkgJ family cysteine cluster protein [Desulfatiglans sp.]|jgi:Fe-S-cluster containining protein|nr:YkgJ family cysteine cluster protein [Desulfatiglans sp.]